MSKRSRINWQLGASSEYFKKREADLHASMPGHRRKLLQRKNLLLMKEVLKEIEHEDTDVIQDVMKGRSITGVVPRTHVFAPEPPEDVVNGKSREWLWRRALDIRRDVVKASSRPTDDEDLMREVPSKTDDEVAAGWADGPHTMVALDCFLGPR